MKNLWLDCILLAQQSPLDNFAREFQGRETRLESGYLTTGILILVGILAACWLLSKVLDHYDGRRPVDSSLMLFITLCKAHRLRWLDWWFLWRVARDQRLDEPGRVFLEPERLDPANVSPVLRLRSEQLAALARRLFAGIAESDGQAPEPGRQEAESRSQPAEGVDPPSPVLPPTPSGASDALGWLPPTPRSEDLPPATFS